MSDKQDFIGAYIELGEAILDPDTGITADVPHVDLWHEQIDYMPEEYPWPSGSLFMEFNMDNIETTGLKVQDMNAEIAFYYVLDTLSETHINSETRDIALAFGQGIRNIHKFLQGRSGVHFGQLDRISVRRIPAPQYLIIYKLTYRCIIRDESAMDDFEDMTFKKAAITQNTQNPPADPDKLYTINL